MTTAQRIKVQPTWDATKVREGAALVAINNLLAAFPVIEKFGPDAIKQYEENWTNNKLDYIKKFDTKTPLDLVKLTAEFEANVFGSVLTYWGDEKSATYSYEVCGCFNVAKESGKFNPEFGEKLSKFFESSTQRIAKHFGFTATVEHEGEQHFPVITFTK